VVELVFMMLILKLPIVYVALVIYWAIKAQPKPLEPALLPVEPEPPKWWNRARRGPRPRRGGPHGSARQQLGPTRRATVRAR
jgi:hypothetical protein